MIKNKKGFTLIELLVVIAIITILAAAVVIGINPARHLRNARNATRWEHMNSIASAVYTYAVENGDFPTDCIGTTTPMTIDVQVDATGAATTGTWCLGDDKLVPEYIRVPPKDPVEGEYYEIQFVGDREGIKITTTADEATSTILIQ